MDVVHRAAVGKCAYIAGYSDGRDQRSTLAKPGADGLGGLPLYLVEQGGNAVYPVLAHLGDALGNIYLLAYYPSYLRALVGYVAILKLHETLGTAVYCLLVYLGVSAFHKLYQGFLQFAVNQAGKACLLVCNVQRAVLSRKCIVKQYLLSTHDTLCLAGEFYAGAAGEAEFARPFIEFIYAQAIRRLAEVVVAGVLYGICQSLVCVLAYLAPAIQVAPRSFFLYLLFNAVFVRVLDYILIVAAYVLVNIQNALCRRRHAGSHFKYGSGRQLCGYCLISGGRGFRRKLAVEKLLILLRAEARYEPVWVEGGIGCHGKYLPGVYVHDHCGTGLCRLYAFHVTVGLFFVILIILQQLLFFLCVYLGYKILKGLFDDGLKVYVYG